MIVDQRSLNFLLVLGYFMNRRQFTGAITVSSLCVCCKTAFSQNIVPFPRHCNVDDTGNIGRVQLFSSSGNDTLDRALIAEMRKVIGVFNINPGIKYFDDYASPNAWASTENVVPNTRGTIGIGLSLIEEEMSTRFGGAAVAGIAAHEGAHIFQFFSNFVNRISAGPTARETELHADLLAGFYFSNTQRTEPSLVAFGQSLFSKGSYDYNSPNHHGTPDERINAMRFGYQLGSRGLTLNETVYKGIDYVT